MATPFQKGCLIISSIFKLLIPAVFCGAGLYVLLETGVDSVVSAIGWACVVVGGLTGIQAVFGIREAIREQRLLDEEEAERLKNDPVMSKEERDELVATQLETLMLQVDQAVDEVKVPLPLKETLLNVRGIAVLNKKGWLIMGAGLLLVVWVAFFVQFMTGIILFLILSGALKSTYDMTALDLIYLRDPAISSYQQIWSQYQEYDACKECQKESCDEGCPRAQEFESNQPETLVLRRNVACIELG